MIKVGFVLAIMTMYDAPMIQLYVSTALQCVSLAFTINFKPFDTKRKNYEDILFTVITIILMATCAIYGIEDSS